MGSRRFYQPADVVLARVTTDPGDVELPADLDLLDDGATGEAGRQWLTRIWQRPEVRTAVRLASPALSRQIDSVLDGRISTARLRRVIVSLVAYLLRWRQRPTPFGLFAGITTAQAGPTAKTLFGTDHRLLIRTDAHWLSMLIDQVERDPGLLPRLRVMTNSAGVTRGERFVVPGRPSTAEPGPGPLVEISVRLTRPVHAALAAATHPIQFSDLTEQLNVSFPTVPSATIHTMLSGLVEQDVLLTNLRPAANVADGLAHLVAQLRAAGGDQLPDIAPLLADLTAIHQDLTGATTGTPAADTTKVTVGVAARMTTLCDGSEHLLTVDTTMDGQITVPPTVLEEAATAASVLLRLTTHPFGTEAWKDFHVRVRDTYGPGALIPVRDLIADSGLGFPAGFLGAARGKASRQVTDRDATLMALIQQAAIDGHREIELTEQTIQNLIVGDHDELVAPPRVELAFEIHATSTEALQRGRFQLWITGAPRPQSSMAGRFAPLLPEPTRHLLATTYTTGKQTSDVIVAQLSFPPRRLRNDNVVRMPQLLPNVISLGEYPASHSRLISVDDLAVTADATQMYLVQTSTGRRVLPRVLHALEASVQTPPLARFLAEVATARHAAYGPFDFGMARTMPHLPRVRYGRTILAPARWIITASDLPGRRETMEVWDKAVAAWRERWNVPTHIVVVEGELRLPLDLDHRLHRSLLRTRLNRAGQLEIREAPNPAGRGWIGRACELLVPMTALPATTTGGAARSGRTVQAAVQPPAPAALPGAGDVIHAQLLGHPARYAEILTDHLPHLLESLGTDLVRWWFRRHRDTTRPDTDQQLWLYLRLRSRQRYGPAATHLADFAADLHHRSLLANLTLAPYRPQTGRYGPDVTAAEQVTAADSTAVLAQLTMAAQADLPGQAITAASMTDLAASLAPDTVTGYWWLVDQLPHDSGKLDRNLRDVTLRLADPAGDTALARHPGGPQTAAAWRQRRTVLAAYRNRLTTIADPATVLRSLLHDQHVRSIGVDPEQERITYRLPAPRPCAT